MIRNTMIKPLLVIAALSVAGCSSMFGDHGVFRGKGKDYLNTASVSTIEVPEELRGGPISQLYPIPEVAPRDEFGDPIRLTEYDVPRPVAMNAEKGLEGVKLQRLGDQKWIFLNASTSQVWPRTQNFLAEYRIRVVSSNPQRGLIETDDVLFNEAPDLKSRFRIYIEKGVHPETTEIHIIHAQFPATQTVPADYQWPKQSMDIAREHTLLDGLAEVLAKSVNNNSASLLGQNVGGALKVELMKENQEPMMRLRLMEERAKASVAHALEREGFVLWEESSHRGLFYVGFDPEFDEDPGFFSRLFRRDFPQKAPHSLDRVLQHLSAKPEVKQAFSDIEGAAFGNVLPEVTGLLVKVESEGDAVDIILRDARGEKLAPDQAKNLLRLIRKNLI